MTRGGPKRFAQYTKYAPTHNKLMSLKSNVFLLKKDEPMFTSLFEGLCK
jgi:hypothetical protein